MDKQNNNNNEKRAISFYTNKVGYAVYLIENPNILRQLRGQQSVVAIAVMDCLLFRYCKSLSSAPAALKNRTYTHTITTYLDRIPEKIIVQTIKKLRNLEQICAKTGELLQISNSVLQYFHEVTDIKINKNNKIINKSSFLKTEQRNIKHEESKEEKLIFNKLIDFDYSDPTLNENPDELFQKIGVEK
jgi:hypothetical protein